MFARKPSHMILKRYCLLVWSCVLAMPIKVTRGSESTNWTQYISYSFVDDFEYLLYMGVQKDGPVTLKEGEFASFPELYVSISLQIVPLPLLSTRSS